MGGTLRRDSMGGAMNTAKPEDLGMSTERLERLSGKMKQYVDRELVAGIITMVYRKGEIVHCEKFGMMDREAGKKMEFDTIFRIYSMTKPITSVAIMMLLEEGRLKLSDPLADFVPEFKQTKVFVDRRNSILELEDLDRDITIHDLLTHTSGLSYGFDENSYVDSKYDELLWNRAANDPAFSLEDLVADLAGIPLVFQPGTNWRYSVATDVLGRVIEVISGIPFADFLSKRVFEPLEMGDTFFTVPEGKLVRFAAVYGQSDDGPGLKPVDDLPMFKFTEPTTTFPSGGGGLCSTAGDYMRFAQMLINKGAYTNGRILSRKSVELMSMNHLPRGMYPDGDESRGFGLGFGVITNVAGTKMLGSIDSYSWGGAAGTIFWIDPKEDLIGLMMRQSLPAETVPINEDVRNLVYQAIAD